MNSILIGVSACLLGEKVRYDGGHKKENYLTDTLGNYFSWVPFCPELEMGLGTPRESMRLEKEKKSILLKTVKTGQDHTSKIEKFSSKKVRELERLNLSGVLFKSKSPSCGMEKVKVYHQGIPYNNGIGFFARELMEKYPDLPVEEEGRLRDEKLRENWISRVFAYNRFLELTEKFSKKKFIEFHTAHKLILLSHSPAKYAELGRIVAKGNWSMEEVLDYRSRFMSALRIIATKGRHVNVLEHMAGYFKKQIDKRDREELRVTFDSYKRGEVPLIVPLTLIKHYVNKFEISYLQGQHYLNPHPKELALRNHV